MKRDPLKASVLATKLIPNVSPGMAKELNLTPEQRSLALLTADCDDVTYTALDEATKKADYGFRPELFIPLLSALVPDTTSLLHKIVLDQSLHISHIQWILLRLKS